MEYKDLTEVSQIEELIKDSKEFPHGVLIFKHSTRCAISSMAFERMKRNWKVPMEDLPIFYLDILRYRDVSNAVSERFGVQHESPQILLVRGGRCVFDASHSAISPGVIEKEAVNAQ